MFLNYFCLEVSPGFGYFECFHCFLAHVNFELFFSFSLYFTVNDLFFIDGFGSNFCLSSPPPLIMILALWFLVHLQLWDPPDSLTLKKKGEFSFF